MCERCVPAPAICSSHLIDPSASQSQNSFRVSDTQEAAETPAQQLTNQIRVQLVDATAAARTRPYYLPFVFNQQFSMQKFRFLPVCALASSPITFTPVLGLFYFILFYFSTS